jgi:2,3-bisphosphoglycerate-dependent phosphoglycerate mutase
MTGEIVLVRHASPVLPRPGGPDDHHRALTAEGVHQARRLVGELPAPELVVSSPYRRAVQTVEPLARAYGLTVRTDPRLREWDSGLEPRPDYARHHTYSWDNPDHARAGGESLARLTDRATTALLDWAAHGPVVVGSHGTFVARALLGFGVDGIDWPFCAAMPMPAVYRLRWEGGRVVVSGPGLTDR